MNKMFQFLDIVPLNLEVFLIMSFELCLVKSDKHEPFFILEPY